MMSVNRSKRKTTAKMRVNLPRQCPFLKRSRERKSNFCKQRRVRDFHDAQKGERNALSDPAHCVVVVASVCRAGLETSWKKEKVETTRIKKVRCYRGMSGRIEGRKLGQEDKRGAVLVHFSEDR